jgi:mannosylglycerate hydrolase
MVSHTHWDREWYRTFQSFRARLVGTVDKVLDLVGDDPGFHFQLDGQTIVIEDYLEIRPDRRAELEAAVQSGRVAIGPWYVQPDSLIPTGETHVRNLLEGRRVASEVGPCSTIAYTPDSFGHPAQFPQLFEGFGLGPFIYWRGNDDEIASLPADYRWMSPNGSQVVACRLGRGYFPAWGLSVDVEASVARLKNLVGDLAPLAERDTVLLMNGLDHIPPDDNTLEVAEALAKETGWTVERGLLDDYVDELGAHTGSEVDEKLPLFEGELLGGRVANLLPGVWSTHSELKIANRRCEAELTGWLEPWVALGLALGTPDERPSLRLAWRALLPNQAHDSICGCSQDRVHEHMATRYDDTHELAWETTDRLLDLVSGHNPDRQVLAHPETGEVSIAVFNPSPHPRTDVVDLPLTGFPAFSKYGVSPLLAANLGLNDETGIHIDGEPARLTRYEGTTRPNLTPQQPVHDLQFVARDVPAFGWRRFILSQGEATPESVDGGREIAAGEIVVRAQDDGRLDLRIGESHWPDLLGLEDIGDRGDTYDFDPVVEDGNFELGAVSITRRRHPSGIEELTVRRVISVPESLTPDRSQRTDRLVHLPVTWTARVAPGMGRVDLAVSVDNTARDHRLRLLLPTGAPLESFEAATTFDTAVRSTAPRDGGEWLHPAPATIPQQGWIHAGGLGVAAPGLLEAEVTAEGVVAITLLRATGWLSRPDLTTRPGEAGPSLQTPGAQVQGLLEAQLSLYAGLSPDLARDAELRLRAVAAGPTALHPPDVPLLEMDRGPVELSALKPAENGTGSILRLLNPTDETITARVRFAPAIADTISSVESVRLDELPIDAPVEWRDGELSVELAPHSLRSMLLRQRR